MNNIVGKIRAKWERINALAWGTTVCGCGGFAHFLMHPCLEHAIAAVMALGLGLWFALNPKKKAQVSEQIDDRKCVDEKEYD